MTGIFDSNVTSRYEPSRAKTTVTVISRKISKCYFKFNAVDIYLLQLKISSITILNEFKLYKTVN